MTPYAPQDLEGYEFKILRSGTAKAFRDPARLRAVLEEEARSGWDLLEKFDDYRLRLKRRTEWRDRDPGTGVDPYRIHVGTTPGQVGARILIGIGVFVAILVAVAALVAS